MVVPPELTPCVTWLAAYDVDLGSPGVHRGLPSTTVTFVLPCGEPLDVSWQGRPDGRGAAWSSVSGLHDRPALIHHSGRQTGVQLALTVTGARALFGVPARELAGQLLTLDDADPRLAHLPELLAETPHPRRADVVARAVAEALARRQVTQPRAAVARALARLTRGHAVQAVADEVGYSRRHLATLVRDETGLAPKQLQRIARFERSRTLLGRRPLADVAVACGYADQSHLSRDWSELAGCSPSQWLREEFPFLHDVVDPERHAEGHGHH